MAANLYTLSSSEDVVVEILSRLPPKSLMRFKCVRISWYNLINSPSFVAKNLSNSKNNEFASSSCFLFKRTVLKDNTIKDKNKISLILWEENNDKKDTVISLLILCNHDDQNLGSVVGDLVLPSPIGMYPFNIPIAGHCDGIVCLTSCEDVILCNPAIKEFEFLPKSCLLLPPKDRNDYDDEDDYYDALKSSPSGVGFGYDSKAKVYKVVRIVDFSSGYVFTSHPSRAELYTLEAHSWREIKIDTQCFVLSDPSFNICFKGICYWYALIGVGDGVDKEVILSFDMSDELFHEISVPKSIDFSEGFHKRLAVWKESIVLVSYKDDGPKFLDIWVIGELSGGFKGSWTKHLTIGPVAGEIPLGFWKSDEILMVTADGCVVSYNIGTQTLKNLPIHVAEDPSYIQCVVYVNSIISIKSNNKLDGTIG